VFKFPWGSNVFPFQDKPKDQVFSAVSQVDGYWEGLYAGREIPMRSDVDPRGLENALAYTFVLERIAKGIARFRFAGMHLNDLMGMEVRGMPLTAMFDPKTRLDVSNGIEFVCRDKKVVTMELRCPGSLGKPAMDAKMFMAPLRDDLGEVTKILGCLQSAGPIGRPPLRFDVKSTHCRATIASPYELAQREPVLGFAEPQTAFQHKSKQKRPGDIRPALRVITGKR